MNRLYTRSQKRNMKCIIKVMSAPQGGPSPDAVDAANSSSHVTWLNKRGIKSFYHGVVADDLRSGAQMLLQVIHPPHLCTSTVFA